MKHARWCRAPAIFFVLSAITWSASAHPAWGIVVDRAGRVYFSDLETVWRIDGTRLTVARPGVEGHHVHELFIDDHDNVYGPDYTYHPEDQSFTTGIWSLTRSGQLSWIATPTTTLPRGVGTQRDAAGNTYAVEEDNHTRRETLIVKRTPSGQVMVLAGGGYGYADGNGTAAQFRSIVGIAFGAGGSLFVTDGGTVRRITAAGVVTTVAHDLDAPVTGVDTLSFGGLMGLAVDAKGIVYVADFKNRRVLEVGAGGTVRTILRAEPPWSPTGVAIGKAGDVYALEFGFQAEKWIKPRVRKVDAQGNVSVAAALER